MPSQRIAALALSGLGLLALIESTWWIRWGLADYHEFGITPWLSLGVTFCTILTLCAGASLYIFARPLGSKANPLILAVAGCLISSIGGIEAYVGVILSAQAVFYGVMAAKRTLWIFRLELLACVIAFAGCVLAMVRAAVVRRRRERLNVL